MDTSKFSPEQKQAWASIVKDRGNRQGMAEVITEIIKPNHVTNTYMNYLLRSRSLNSGDLLHKRVRKGMKVHTYVNHPDAYL